mgnify:CR=1 FL=1
MMPEIIIENYNHHLRVLAAATDRRVGRQCALSRGVDSFGVLETLMGPKKLKQAQ